MKSCFTGWKGECSPKAKNDFLGHYYPVDHFWANDGFSAQFPHIADAFDEDDLPRNFKRTDIFVRSPAVWPANRDPLYNDSETLDGWSIPYGDEYDWNIVTSIRAHSSADADICYVLCARVILVTPGFVLKVFCLDIRAKSVLWSQELPTSFGATKPDTSAPEDPSNAFTIFNNTISPWTGPIVSTQTPDMASGRHTRSVMGYDSSWAHTPNEGSLNDYTEDLTLADIDIGWLQSERLSPTGYHIYLACNETTVFLFDGFFTTANDGPSSTAGSAIVALEITSSGVTTHRSVVWDNQASDDLLVAVTGTAHTSTESYSTRPRLAGFCPRVYPKAFFFYPAVQYTFESEDYSTAFSVFEHVKLTYGDFNPGTLNETTLESTPFSVTDEEVVYAAPIVDPMAPLTDYTRTLKRSVSSPTDSWTKNDTVRTKLQFIAGDANEAGHAGCVFFTAEQIAKYDPDDDLPVPFYQLSSLIWRWMVRDFSGSWVEAMRLNPIDQDNDGTPESYDPYPVGQVWQHASDFMMLTATESAQKSVSGRLFATFYHDFQVPQRWTLRVAHVDDPTNYWEMLSVFPSTDWSYTTANMPYFLESSDRDLYVCEFPLWDAKRGRVHHAWRISHDGQSIDAIDDDYHRALTIGAPNVSENHRGYIWRSVKHPIVSYSGPRLAVVQHPGLVR